MEDEEGKRGGGRGRRARSGRTATREVERTLTGNDSGKDREDPHEPPQTAAGAARDRVEEDVAQDLLAADDELGALTEVLHHEARRRKAAEGEADRALAELAEAASV